MKSTTWAFAGAVVFVTVIGLAAPAGTAKAQSRKPQKPPQTKAAGLNPKAVFEKVSHDLEAPETYRNVSDFYNKVRDCVTELKMPPAFAELGGQLEELYEKHDYLACATVAEKMESMIPKNVPTDYPFSEDYHSEWLSEVADLKVLGNDYDGALKTYSAALDFPEAKSDKRFFLQRLAGHQSAAYGRSFVYGILGKGEKALKDLEKAPSYYWSGCGNCMAGEAHTVKRLSVIYKAASLPPDEAETALLKLAAGAYVAEKSNLLGDCVSYERKEAQSDATLILGELYVRQGRQDLARKAFEALTVERTTRNARLAQSRLRSLTGL